jgi:hypothetical protein
MNKALYMKVIGKIISLMVEEEQYMMMDQFMKESGKMETSMEWGDTCAKMGICIIDL